MRRRLPLTLGSLAAASALWWPAFRDPQATGFGDWQYFHHMWEAGYVALTRHGEWPLWDPYHCGGITLFGNPQNQLMSPLFFLSLLVQPTLASKIFVLVHAWIGFAAMAVFARRQLKLDATASAFAAFVWGACGFFAWHGAGGHSAFMPFYFAPLLLLWFRRSLRDLRYAVAVAALLTLVLLEGGVYPFPCLCILLGFDAVACATDRARWRRLLIALASAGLLTALLGAVRLVPIFDELARHPRTTQSVDKVMPLELIEMLTAREHGFRYPGHTFVWPEYGTFVGWGVVLAAAVGIVLAVRARRYWLIAGLLLFGGLTLGDHGALSPWALLHRLPVYDSLRVPSRFAVFLAFFVALCAGLALHALGRLGEGAGPRAIASKVMRWAPALYACLCVADILVVNLRTVDRWTRPPIASAAPAERFHLTARHRYGRYYASLPRLGLGTTGCYEAMSFTVARGLWRGDRPQVRVVGRGRLLSFERSTSRAAALVELQEPGTLLFNQNHAPGWRSNVGTARPDEKGRLIVTDVPAGKHRIEVRYRPWTLRWGASLSGLGALLAVLFLLALERRRWAARRGETGDSGPKSAGGAIVTGVAND